MRLRIHIDRLTIEGMSPAEARQIGDAVRRHVTRLARAAPAPVRPTARQVDRLDGGTVPGGASAAGIGRHVATEIFRELAGPRRA